MGKSKGGRKERRKEIKHKKNETIKPKSIGLHFNEKVENENLILSLFME